ncbi:dephospho-CoA kinase [Lentibacter sp. XHP0401]|mgnify:CR=1 FL=1|jgi:dephospho-CoA kinase|uniref:dephospho-CoA kinase n=1 Tax=Lentibacter sp. XHP0401 TaxID=2984334 RepID=UPI0021E8C4FE|nr:dephospho-CoA kinase [Lentibacter sp. XHP0401]MCV2892601.1 dephospho-CoA kinase [Lentibacter sp. XHP0401]
MAFWLGLTGSIGMGKSTTAKMFAAEGCAVWDADAAVHRLYAEGGLAVGPMSEAFPEAVIAGAVSRERLKEMIGADPATLNDIEKIVHPLVAADRVNFAESAQSDIIVFDIPLLFEGGNEGKMDAVVVVTADEETQRARVLERGTMSETHFETIKAKQMPDVEKRNLADYVVTTDTLESAERQVKAIVKEIRAGLNNA